MNVKELTERAHGNAVKKGFYDLPTTILDKMEIAFGKDDSVYLFSKEEVKAVKDAFITQRLMLITSELGEAMEANRKGRVAKTVAYEAGLLVEVPEKELFEATIKESFEDEMADTMIRIFDLAGWLKIDLDWHIKEKMLYNAGREKMHGGKAY